MSGKADTYPESPMYAFMGISHWKSGSDGDDSRDLLYGEAG